MSILLLVIGILLFIGLVVVHEFGHFIMARRNGVEVEEFGIFFPPRIYRHKTKAGWDFTINLLPLGGFVKLKGEHDDDTEKGTFGAASTWVKSKIMAAGVVMNLITALVLFTILALVGIPKLIDNQFTVKSDTHTVSTKVLVSYVEPGSPAAKSGLKQGDQLVAYTAQQPSQAAATGDFRSQQDLMHTTSKFQGYKVKIEYKRNGQTHFASTTLRSDKEVDASQKTDNPKGHLGIVPTEFSLQRSTWSAPIVAVGFATQVTVLTMQGLGHAVAGLGSTLAGIFTGNTAARQHGQTKASEQVSGPVGIFVILRDGSLLGYQFMLLIIAVISLTLAIMNILPVPALDGGRLWITLIARAFKKKLSSNVENALNTAGFLILISLMVIITFVDVKRFF